MFDGPARSQLGEEPPAVLRLRPNADGDGYGLEEVPPASAVTPARGINFAEMLQIPGPSRAKSAPRSLRRALLMPQVNPGSLYRCGKRS